MTTAVDPRRWWALVVLAFAQFITILDTSIIGVALPDIQQALGFSPEGLSWVFNAYVIAFGGLLLLGGRLGDLFGARNVFAAGLVVLTAGSVVAGVAESETAALTGRAVQGVGAALIGPTALSLLVSLFMYDAKELTKAIAVFGAAAPAALALAVFGIVDANNAGWGSTQTVLVLGGAVGLLTAFVASQAVVREPL